MYDDLIVAIMTPQQLTYLYKSLKLISRCLPYMHVPVDFDNMGCCNVEE